MVALILAIVTYCRAFFLPRHRLGLEAAALRQQLAVLKRKQPRIRSRRQIRRRGAWVFEGERDPGG